MSSITSKLQHKVWTRGDFHISTDPSLIPLATLNDMFASENVYWASPLPEHVWQETLQNSLTFGLYHREKQELSDSGSNVNVYSEPSTDEGSRLNFIGIGRCITDFTTFVYLTDVYISPDFQGKGLGRWLITCIQEIIDSMPYLRRSMLFTSDWKRSVPFYEELMGMNVAEGGKNSVGIGGHGLAVLMRLGPGAPAHQQR